MLSFGTEMFERFMRSLWRPSLRQDVLCCGSDLLWHDVLRSGSDLLWHDVLRFGTDMSEWNVYDNSLPSRRSCLRERLLQSGNRGLLPHK